MTYGACRVVKCTDHLNWP